MPIGPQKLTNVKERTVDTAISAVVDQVNSRHKTTEDQVIADQNMANLILANEKNSRVMDVAAAIGEDLTHVFVPIPVRDQSDEVFAVRGALAQNYPAESEGAAVVRFPLFKRIVDNAILAQEKILERLLFQDGEETAFSDQLHEIKIGQMANILNGSTSITDINNSDPGNIGDPTKDLLITLGVAFLSYQLQKQFHKLAPMFEGTQLLEDANGDPSETPQQLSKKAQKILKIISRITEAVILFALMYKLSKRQTVVLANQVIPPDIDPEIKRQFNEQIVELYDAPPQDIVDIIPQENGTDQTIIEYCLRYIDTHPEKNFDAWIVYSTAALRQMQLGDVIGSLGDSSELVNRYVSPTYTVERQLIREGNVSVAPSLRQAGELHLPKLSNYLPEEIRGNSGQQTLGVNIMDYVNVSNNMAEQSGETSNFFLSILHNNKYTPELICCITNFLVNGNIDEARQYMVNLRDMLKAMQGFSFNYGGFTQDIVNGLFNDLRSKVLTYAYTQISKFFEKRKGELLALGDKIMGDDKYIIFCTPLADVMAQMVRIFEEFQAILEGLLEEILSFMFSFELKIDNGLINLRNTNKYRNIMNILDALVDAIDEGQLCQYDGLQPSDIHPDLLPIIDRLSQQPRQILSTAVEDYRDFQQELIEETEIEGTTVMEFRDPRDPDHRGSVSIDREFNGETTIETIEKYSAQCQAFKESLGNLNIEQLNV